MTSPRELAAARAALEAAAELCWNRAKGAPESMAAEAKLCSAYIRAIRPEDVVEKVNATERPAAPMFDEEAVQWAMKVVRGSVVYPDNSRHELPIARSILAHVAGRKG